MRYLKVLAFLMDTATICAERNPFQRSARAVNYKLMHVSISVLLIYSLFLRYGAYICMNIRSRRRKIHEDVIRERSVTREENNDISF